MRPPEGEAFLCRKYIREIVLSLHWENVDTYIAMCYHKLIEETTVINLTLRPTVNPLPVPNRNAVDLSGSLYMGEYFMLSMHLRQLFRKPTRTALYLAVLILLTAFFCVSLNLYKDSHYNLSLAKETFHTIAVMDLYADVDINGNVVSELKDARDYAGYRRVTVNGYDISPVVSAPSVLGYDLRTRYGAYSENNIAKKKDSYSRRIIPFYKEDVIRFKIGIDANSVLDAYNLGSYITLNLTDDGFAIPEIMNIGLFTDDEHISYITFVPEITWTATDAFLNKGVGYARISISIDVPDSIINKYSNELTALKFDFENKEYVYIEPEIEYIGITEMTKADGFDETMKPVGINGVSCIVFNSDAMFDTYSYFYSNRIGNVGEYVRGTHTKAHPFWLYKYEDVKNSPELSERFEQISRAYYINSRSFCVTTTNDVTGVPAFNVGNMYMKDGRIISDEEYDSGAKVCMISKEQSVVQNWKVGQKINFNFYEYGFFTNATFWNSQLSPRYTYTSPDHFFDSGEYEVVGIYDVRPMTGSSTISEAAISVPWNTIYIPEKSLTNAPAEEDRPVTGALLTIWLENGKIEPFIERMNELGITGAKQGDYEARFTFYDQGYSRIQPSLEALSGTAELLLILSSSLLVIAALLLAFFYAQSQKQSIGTMRLLGCSKARAFVAVMLSALIIAVTGALIGAAIGHALTASVGESIMANANQTPDEFLAFSAYLAESTQVEVEFALGADAKVSLLTCLAALGLFIAGTLVFVLRYLGKGPRELLPRAGE